MVWRKVWIALNPMGPVRVIWRHRELAREMVARVVATRYRGSMLGALWSLAQPLLTLAVYTFVFSVVMKARWGVGEHESSATFAVVMFCGMAMFNIFSEAAMSGCQTITGNPNYVKKVVFPLEILPFAQTVAVCQVGMMSFALLFAGAWIVSGRVSWTVVLLPLTLGPLFLVSTGVAYLTASLTVYWRDLPHFLGIVLQSLFFMTPIVYPVAMVPERFRVVLLANPMTWLVEQTRALLLFGHVPDARIILGLWLGAAVIFQLGYGWFTRTKRGFADVL